MGRRPRCDIAGGVHHVMNRGVNRQRVFFGDGDRIEFGSRLADIHERFGVETVAYCLMTNHYHLVLRAPAGHLSDAMHHLGLVYTRRTNERIGRDGPLFRGRYHSIPVTTDHQLLRAVRYVHRNPLDIVGVDRLADFRWSSYRTYLGCRRPPSFLDTDLVLGLLGGDRGRLAQLTEGDDQPPPTCVDDVTSLVRSAVAADDLHHGDDAAINRWHERTVSLLLAERLADTPLGQELFDALEIPSPAARRMALLRARRRRDDPAIRRILDRVTVGIRY